MGYIPHFGLYSIFFWVMGYIQFGLYSIWVVYPILFFRGMGYLIKKPPLLAGPFILGNDIEHFYLIIYVKINNCIILHIPRFFFLLYLWNGQIFLFFDTPPWSFTSPLHLFRKFCVRKPKFDKVSEIFALDCYWVVGFYWGNKSVDNWLVIFFSCKSSKHSVPNY